MPSIDITTIKNALHTWIRGSSGLSADRVLWDGQPAPEAAGNDLPWISLGRITWSAPGWDWVEYKNNPLVFTAKPFTLDATTDQLTATAHTLTRRSGPVQIATTGSLAGSGLTVGTHYWVGLTGANTLRLATSFLAADQGTYIDILGAGTGTHTLVSIAGTLKAGEELREISRGARKGSFTVTCFPPIPSTDTTEAVMVLSDISAKSWLSIYANPIQDANIGLLNAGSPQSINGVRNSVYFEPRAVMTVVFTTTSEVEAPWGSIEYVDVESDPPGETFVVSSNDR